MSIVFDESYFHGSDTGYTDYKRDLWPEDGVSSFADKAQLLLERAATKGVSLSNRKVLILGCAFGYTVEYLMSLGVDAYGMDISSYAISQAPVGISSRLRIGDARVRADLNAARTMAGIAGNARFDLIVSEDLLPCYTDAQCTAAATEWRSRHAQRVAHRISIGNYEGGYNLKTLPQWRALLGAQDWIFDYTTWVEG